jgi:hypothetical protein
MTSWELEEHLGRLAIGTLCTLFVICFILLIGVIITSLSPSELIILSIGIIVVPTIGYFVGRWMLG